MEQPIAPAERPRRAIGPAPGRYHPAGGPRLPWDWWAANPRYRLYMLRELSSLFVALWSARCLVQFARLREGPGRYERFLAAQRRPGWLLFNLVAFAFSLLHAVTWLQLAGVVQTVRIGRRVLDPRMVSKGAFAGWAVASLGIAGILLRGGRRDRSISRAA
jgi:fumarate reductase subunit C